MSDSAIRESLPEDLRYVDDSQPGISRKNVNGNVRYYDANGERITDDDQIKRLDALAVPPSYTDVWLCANPNGHLQATGRDSNGKKQYLYHARWREVRDANKYANLAAFGKALPALRKQLNQHIAQQQLSREKVLATVVKLLDTTLIRVGNNEYARRNKSYGVTTLRTRHVEITGNKLQFEFRGKSGVEHQISIKDRRLARVVKRCQDLPGQALFQYLDENKNRHSIDSSDVNAYLHKLCQADFTAKDFRTWAAT
ncbi:hypothetical protein, partial [Arsukibacterium sp.]|uniref:DNA topoisomerase IB n=1 Tax=Arsukibacterium sp. TaxID=1977258 RepID=UPI00299DF2E7